jgi:hypothetical protein
MNILISARRALFTISLLGFPASALAQGSLTPPGAPEATMKTLQQIEPRIDVATLAGDANSHVIISNVGSYYLSTNLAVTRTFGITIDAAGVTLDLNGFEIARVSGSGGSGVVISTNGHRATVRNGSVRGFGLGINASAAPNAKNCLFEKLAATGCSSVGIIAGQSARVVDCRAHDNSGHGITAGLGTVITGCTAQGNQGGFGIRGEAACIISDCAAYNNVATSLSSYGIYGGGGSTIIGCTSYLNSNTNALASADRGVGIFVAFGMVKDCTVQGNQGDGIQVGGTSLVEGNTCDANGNGGDGAGIHSTGSRNRIEANHVTSNDRGIDVDSTASLIIRNSAGNNTTNYTIAANNIFGAIVDRTAPASGAVSGNSAASSAATTDPWANFSF